MTETEIERLVVRLVGDNTDYKRMLTDSVSATERAYTAMENEVARLSAGGDMTGIGTLLHEQGKLLRDREAALGKSADALAREAMAALGASKDELTLLDALSAQHKVLVRQEEAFARKEQYIARAAGATNQYAAQVDDLRILLEHGAITQDQYNENLRQLEASLPESQRIKAVAEAIDLVTSSYRRQAETAGMTKGQAEIHGLRKMGADPGQVQQVVTAQGQAEAATEAANLAKSILDVKGSLNEQAATAGKTADEMVRYRLEQQGATKNELALIESMQKATATKLEAVQAEATLNTALQGTSKTMEDQLKTLGMTSEELVRYRLGQQGATDAQLQTVEGLQKQVKSRRENLDSMQQGEQITKSMMTADELRQEQLTKLGKLLDDGHIKQETYNKAVEKMSTQHLQQSIGALSEVTGQIALFTGLLTAGSAAVMNFGLQAATKFEETTIAFSTMMGSVEKGSAILQDLTEFAVKTPFEMPELENVARGLVMFGESAETVMETLEMLGNVASGVGRQHFNMIGIIYNQIRGVGHLLTGDFRQLSTRGAISLHDIAKYYKVTDAAAQQMISHGKVSFNDFRQIMIATTQDAGRFADMMEKQGQTLGGLQSTYSDAQGIAMRKVADNIVPAEKAWLRLKIVVMNSIADMSGATAKLVAGSLYVATALGGLTATVAGSIFATTKIVSVWTTLNSTLKASAESSYAAATALKALTAAKWLAAGAGVALGVAVAGIVAYNVVKWAHESTEAFKQMRREMADVAWERGQEGKAIAFEVKNTVDTGRLDVLLGEANVNLVTAQDKLDGLNKKWFADEVAIADATKELGLYQDLVKQISERKMEVEITAIPLIDRRAMYNTAKEYASWAKAEIKRLEEEILNRSKTIQDIQGSFRASDPRAWYVEQEPKLRKAMQELEALEKQLERTRGQYEQTAEQERNFKNQLDVPGLEGKSGADIDKTVAENVEKVKKLKDELNLNRLLREEAARRGIAVKDLTDVERERIRQTKVEGVGMKEGEASQNKAALAELDTYLQLMHDSAWEKGRKSVEEITKKYEEQASAIGKTKIELELLKLSQDKSAEYGATDFSKIRVEEVKTAAAMAAQSMLSPAEKMKQKMEGIRRDAGEVSKEYQAALALFNTMLVTGQTENPMFKQLAEALPKLRDKYGENSEEYRTQIRALGKTLEDQANPVKAVTDKIDNLDVLLAKGAISAEAYQKELSKIRQELTGIKDPGREAADQLKRMNAAGVKEPIMGEYLQGLAGLKDPVRDFNREVQSMQDSLNPDQFKAWQDAAQGAFTRSLDPLRSMKDEVGMLNAKLAAGAITADAHAEKMRLINRSVTDSLSPVAAYADKVRELDYRHEHGGLSQKDYDLSMREAKKSLGQLTEAELDQIAAQTRKMDAMRAGTDAYRQMQQYTLEFLAQSAKAGDQMLEANKLIGGVAEAPKPPRDLDAEIAAAEERMKGASDEVFATVKGSPEDAEAWKKLDARQAELDKLRAEKTFSQPSDYNAPIIDPSRAVKLPSVDSSVEELSKVIKGYMGEDWNIDDYDLLNEKYSLAETKAQEARIMSEYANPEVAFMGQIMGAESAEAQAREAGKLISRFSTPENQAGVVGELETRVGAMTEEEKQVSIFDELLVELQAIRAASEQTAAKDTIGVEPAKIGA